MACITGYISVYKLSTLRSFCGSRSQLGVYFQPFEDYWSLEDVSDGLKREELHKGTIRINPRNFEEAYLDNPVSMLQKLQLQLQQLF